MDTTELSLRVLPSRKPISFKLFEAALFIQPDKSSAALAVPHRQVIQASYEHQTHVLKIAYLFKARGKQYHCLTVTHAEVPEPERARAGNWAEQVMHICYEQINVSRYRRLKVMINPYGGKKRAVLLFNKIVEPILRTAGCILDVTCTTHSGHAYEMAKNLPFTYDAVVTVSGDGLIHEVMNGFGDHVHPMKAFSIPVAPIPTGSGNGLSINLLGIEDGFDVAMATLNAIKGRPMKVDLFSFTQGGKQSISFMSQALGLVADLDIRTEHLRWMGDTRFLYGLMRGIIQFKSCPVRLTMKVVESDKRRMHKLLQGWHEAVKATDGTMPIPATEELSTSQLPPVSYTRDDQEEWLTIEEPLLYVYAGKGPYVARDFMAFPVSVPNDGLIDILAMPLTSRTDFVSYIEGASVGNHYWHPRLHYIKASAYRIKPLKPVGCLAVDGEAFPFQEYQVEVHKGLGTFLSLCGHYAVNFSAGEGSKG